MKRIIECNIGMFKFCSLCFYIGISLSYCQISVTKFTTETFLMRAWKKEVLDVRVTRRCAGTKLLHKSG
jgi:hypothetical protein